MILLLAGAVLPSLLVTWLAAFYICRNAPSWGLVDEPGHRKLHEHTIPTGGGMAIWLGIIVPLAAGQAMLSLVESGYVSESLLPKAVQIHLGGLALQSGRLWIVLAGATAMMVLGLVDDRRGLDWRLRLAVQTLVACLMVAAWEGWRLTAFLNMPAVGAVLSVIWIVGLINSFNMLDNMDGLSAGVAAIASGILAAVMLIAPDPVHQGPQLFVAGFLLVLVGALLGFLWHNRPPARLFMGDAGSYLVGFCMAMATLTATFAGGDLPRHAILAPLCVLAVPLYDTISVIAIRWREGRSPFVGDTSHFSHRLVELGLSKKHAVWTIYLATATCGMGALVLHQVDTLGAVIVLLSIACVLAIIAILESAARRRR